MIHWGLIDSSKTAGERGCYVTLADSKQDLCQVPVSVLLLNTTMDGKWKAFVTPVKGAPNRIINSTERTKTTSELLYKSSRKPARASSLQCHPTNAGVSAMTVKIAEEVKLLRELTNCWTFQVSFVICTDSFIGSM